MIIKEINVCTNPKQRRQQAFHHDILLWLVFSSNQHSLPKHALVLLPTKKNNIFLVYNELNEIQYEKEIE